jgi:nitrogen fixation protein FixH
MTRTTKKFTGRDALLWVFLFFGTIATVNGIMIWFALKAGSGS